MFGLPDSANVMPHELRGADVVGFVVLTYNFFEQGFIPQLAVHLDHRRSGVASELLRAAEAECRAPKRFASVISSNEVAQVVLQRAGFERSGVIENPDPDDPEYIDFKPVAEHER